jgi:UDP-glucose 4-epimerase
VKVLITGGSGFVGSHCVDAFLAAGHDVTVFDRVPPIHSPVGDHVIGELRDAIAVDKVVKRSDLVIHAGGLLGTHETILTVDDAVKTNILGTLNILQATTRHKRKLINISKPNVWLNPYSITKDCSEKFCFMFVEEFDAQVTTVKLYNVYGPRQKYRCVRKAIPTWIVDALNGNPIEIFGSGSSTVDLIHARDVAQGIVAIVDNFEACRLKRTIEIADDVYGRFPKHNEQILELGSGKSITVNETVDALVAVLGVPVDVKHLPMRRGEIDGTHLSADITRMTGLTGFRPGIDLIEGLRETVAYYTRMLPEIVQGIL